MDYAKILPRAIEVVGRDYSGKLDRGGNPYILHLLRVMGRVDRNIEKVLAIIHDWVENEMGTSYELILLLGIIEEYNDYEVGDLVSALDYISKKKNEKYFDYINRLHNTKISRAGQLAINVKIADLQDNLEEWRLAILEEDLADFLRNRYTRALKILQST